MANDYYTPTGSPTPSGALTSATIRSEFAAIAAAFDKLPAPGAGDATMVGGELSNSTIITSQLLSANLGTATQPSGGSVYAIDVALANSNDYTTLGVGTAGIGRHASYPQGFTLFRSATSAALPVPAITVDNKGNVMLGGLAAPLATTATDSFFYIPTCAGTPTGVPSVTGAAGSSLPMVYDKTNNKIAVYSGGSWKQTAALM